jgi:coenzyme F420-reducing hydrogenase alpha subunit
MKIQVDVHHLTRVEGHGNIAVRVRDGRLEEARWDVVETPRFFEVMFRGKHYSSAGLLAARICGICSISHCLCSLRAVERAFDVEPPEPATRLRWLAKHGETLQSHLLHLFFLAAPDFLGLDSAIPLADSDPETLNRALRLKGLANRLCDEVAGRTTHPVALQPGGVSRVPPRPTLLGLRDELGRALEDLQATAALLHSFEVPDFERETEFVSLKGEERYPFIGGALVSSDGVLRDENDYLEMTNEQVVPGNTTKWSRLSRDSYAVGPLARVNNNFDLLHPEARKVAASFGLEPVCHRPFMAHVARLVECVHCVHEAIEEIDRLALVTDPVAITEVAPHAAEGVGAVEAPRGILFHHYRFDGEGRIERANCVVPTTQNNGNIHRDLPVLVRQCLERGVVDDRELERLCSMLVRSYDPCISCSVH